MTTQPHVVFVKTSTDEKIDQMNYAARAKGLPMWFVNVRHIAGTQHTTLETTATGPGNRDAKMEEYKALINTAATENSSTNNNLKSLLRKFDIRYDPSHIHFMVDDTENGIKKTYVDGLEEDKRAELFAHIPQDLQDKLAKQKEYWPGAEIAPMMSAFSGVANMFKAFKKAFGTVVLDGQETANLIVRTLSDPTRTSFEGTFKQPCTLDLTSKVSESAVLADCIFSGGLSTLSDEYITNKHPRAQFVDAFAKQLGISPDQDWKLKAVGGGELSVVKEVDVGSFQTLDLNKQRRAKFIERAIQGGANKADIASNIADYLRDLVSAVNGADALVMMPYDTKTLSREEKIKWQFLDHSLMVSQQLNLSHANTPVIFMNLNGCYDHVLETNQRLTNLAMCKDTSFMRNKVSQELDLSGVEHTSNMYGHVLSGTDSEAMNKARNALLEWHKQAYFKSPALSVQDNEATGANAAFKFKDAVEAGKDTYKVAVFMSAGSENKQLNQDTKAFGGWLAKKGMGVVYGGGDQYMMGSLLDGYTEARGKYIAGFSTPEIIKSETVDGKFSQKIHHQVLNKDIYDRMAQMIALADDAIVVRPGGVGTMQELEAVLLLREAFKGVPEIANKKIIIQNPKVIDEDKGFYDEVLVRLLGKGALTKYDGRAGSRKGGSRGADGIYIMETDEQVEQQLSTLKGVWQRQQKQKQPVAVAV